MIALVGEAWGESEERLQHPFVGSSGAELMEMLAQAGLMDLSSTDRANIKEYWRSGRDTTSRNPFHLWNVWQAHPEFLVTNVFNLRPKPTNDIKNLCGPKADGITGMPALQPGKYVNASYESELTRLYDQLKSRGPTLIVALGATAAWALCGTSGIKGVRGTPTSSRIGIKVLPTYHPAAVMRDWGLRPITIADLTKAKREAQFPELRRPHRDIWIEPTVADLDFFYSKYIMDASAVSVDIETKGDMITCIGFAPAANAALVIPFYDHAQADKNYWRTFEEERYAWHCVRSWLAEDRRFIFQNGLYDMHILWRCMGFTCPGAEDDTMLLHHALQPELEKSLGFLGSIYTDEASWKFMRKGVGTIKRED